MKNKKIVSVFVASSFVNCASWQKIDRIEPYSEVVKINGSKNELFKKSK